MSLPGVSDVKVRYEERSIDVTFDDAKISVREIQEEIGREMGLAMEPGEPVGRLPLRSNVTALANSTCPSEVSLGILHIV